MSTVTTTVDELLKDIARINDSVKWLRDKSGLKDPGARLKLGNVRTHLFNAETELISMQETLTPEIANTELG